MLQDSRLVPHPVECTTASGGNDYLADLLGSQGDYFVATTVALLSTGVKEATEIWEVADQTVYRLIECGEVHAEKRRVGFKRMRYAIPAGEVWRIRKPLDGEIPGNKYSLVASA